MSDEVEKKEEKAQTKETVKNNAKGFAISSMVLGIVSLVFLWAWYFAIPCAVLAIIFSIVAKKKAGKNGMTTAGFVTGIVSLSIAAVMIILITIGIAMFSVVGRPTLQRMIDERAYDDSYYHYSYDRNYYNY